MGNRDKATERGWLEAIACIVADAGPLTSEAKLRSQARVLLRRHGLPVTPANATALARKMMFPLYK